MSSSLIPIKVGIHHDHVVLTWHNENPISMSWRDAAYVGSMLVAASCEAAELSGENASPFLTHVRDQIGAILREDG